MYIDNYGRLVVSDELYHHGIAGMRWGKKNGPPYPLSPSSHSAREKKLKDKNKEKLESWQNKEIRKSDKKHDKLINELDRKIAKREKKLSNAKSDKKKQKIKKSLNEYKVLKARRQVMKALEKDAIKKMTLADVKKEKRNLRRRGADLVLSALASSLIKPNGNSLGSNAVTLNNFRVDYIRRNNKGYKTASRIKNYAKSGGNINKYAKRYGYRANSVNDLMPHRGRDWNAINFWTKQRYR